ncbi:hypothetical protein MD484_g7999, partial [Candolleomyces efflorescens]
MPLLRLERTTSHLCRRHRAAASLLTFNVDANTTTAARRVRPLVLALSKSLSSTATPNKDVKIAKNRTLLIKVSSSKPISTPTIGPTGTAELPPMEDWRKTFRFSEKRKRKTLCNEETAKKLAELFVPEGSKDKIIVEGYAGPGLLTRALLALPRERIKKLIVIEEEPHFREWLDPLQKIDDRLHVVPEDAFWWTTYSKIEDDGLLDDVKTHDWNEIHPNLQFVCQVPNNVHGEQLIAQLCRAIPDRKWFFKYGRVPLDLITTSTMYTRLSSTPTDYRHRTKVGVITQAAAHLESLLPQEALEPASSHFFYPTKTAAKGRTGKVAEMPQQHVRVTPRIVQGIDPDTLEAWDYVVRNLMITKATPLSKCITGLGPGAGSLLKKVTDPSLPPEMQIDVKKTPRELTTEEWRSLVQAFEEWPFRPEQLSIDTSFTSVNKHSAR